MVGIVYELFDRIEEATNKAIYYSIILYLSNYLVRSLGDLVYVANAGIVEWFSRYIYRMQSWRSR